MFFLRRFDRIERLIGSLAGQIATQTLLLRKLMSDSDDIKAALADLNSAIADETTNIENYAAKAAASAGLDHDASQAAISQIKQAAANIRQSLAAAAAITNPPPAADATPPASDTPPADATPPAGDPAPADASATPPADGSATPTS
jgi:hypothetical protein